MIDQAIVGGEERARRAREEIEKLWDEYITLVGMDDGYALVLGKEKFFDAVATFAAEASGIGELQWPADAAFALGDLVQKKGRASWRGKVVGWYRTDLTALGLAVESIFEPGSVQIYPQTALEPLPNIDCSGLAQEAARNTKPQEPTL